MDGRKEHLVCLGLGSNLGDRRENLLAALRLLDAMEEMRILEISSVYETEPWGVTEQPDFLNLVALLSTTRDPGGVLDACREVEKKLGRERDGRWGPRVIDVDILLYDDLELEGEDLVIPHPRMLERDFVMVPLAELNPPLPLPHEGRGERTGEQDSTGRVRIAFRYEEEEWHG